MALKVDTFTEASNTTLPSHISDSGLGWSLALPSFFLSIDSILDELKNDTGFFGFGIGLETISNADYFVEVSGKTGGATANDNFGSILRQKTGTVGGTFDFYYGYISGDGTWTISKVIGTDGNIPVPVTSLATGAITGFSASTFYLLKFGIIGNSLTLSIDGTQVGSASDSTLTATGFLGVGIGGLAANGSTSTRIASLNSDLNSLSVPVNAFFRYQAQNKAFRYKALSNNFRYKALSKNFRYIAGK